MAPRHRAKVKHKKVAPVERRISLETSTSTAQVTAARPPSGTPFSRGQGAAVPPGFYNYITRDLRTIGVIAGAMFVALVILSFFL